MVILDKKYRITKQLTSLAMTSIINEIFILRTDAIVITIPNEALQTNTCRIDSSFISWTLAVIFRCDIDESWLANTSTILQLCEMGT
jgi:hypothetical protein